MSDPRITEEAVQAATRSLAKTFVTNKPVAGSKDFRVDARAALEAALPHLAPVDRNDLVVVLARHVRKDVPGRCFCGFEPAGVSSYSEHLADAVLALINGSAS